MSRVSASAMRDTEEAVRKQMWEEEDQKRRAQRRAEANAQAQERQARESAERARQERACWCGRDHLRKEELYPSQPQQRPDPTPQNEKSARVYVGNLPFRSSPIELEVAFQDLIPFHFTVHLVGDGKGGHKGTAFLSLVSADRAAEAVRLLDGHQIAGRALKAAFAEGKKRRQQDRPSRPTNEEVRP